MKKFIYIILFFVFSIQNIIAQSQTDIDWPTLANSPWPMIKHDPQFTGRSPYKGPQTPTIVWTVDMPNGIFSGPVIGEEGNLYFGSYFLDFLFQGISDYFYSYSPNGSMLWNYKLGTSRPPQSGILIDSSNTIYFGSLDKYFYALNLDGTLKWKYETSAPIPERAMPNIDLQGRLYITNGLGELYSINPNGTLNWKVKYEGGFNGRSPAFSPDGNTIYIAGKDSNLFVLNLDGNIKWKFSCGKIQKAPMIDSDGNIYFIPDELPQYFYSIKPDGLINWKSEIQNLGPFDSYSVPTIDKWGNLYVIAVDTKVTPNRALLSFDFDGNFRWSYIFDDPSDDFWQPLICDSEGTVYVGSTFGYYYYAISSNGELKWKLPLNNYQVDNTGAISEDGTLYLGVHKSSLSYNQKKTLIAIKDTGTTSVDNDFKVVNYNLEQNYPNPFNPTTAIRFEIPKQSYVTLKVYNILGQEIAALVKEVKQPGRYEVAWDASGLVSGVYFYRLQAGSYTETKKLILLR